MVQIIRAIYDGESTDRRGEAGLGFGIRPSWFIAANDRDIVAVPLDMIPRVEVYFGRAQFLTRNIYVMELYEICLRGLLPPAAPGEPQDIRRRRNREAGAQGYRWELPAYKPPTAEGDCGR